MAESTGILLLNAEDNDLSGLTITEEGSNDLTISSGAALHGSLGYEFAFSGNTGENLLYFSKSFTAGDDIYARCYFYIPSSFESDNFSISILEITHGAAISNYLAFTRFYNSGGNIIIDRFYYYVNAGLTYTSLSGINISRDTLYYLEMRYKTGSGDGIASLWLNGTQIASLSELTNDKYQPGYVIVGNMQAAVPTAGSKIYIDDIKVDSSYIGSYAESDGSSLPAIINNYRQQGVM